MDRITDLPVNYSKYLTNRRPASVQSHSASVGHVYEQQQPAPQPQFSQTEPAQQYRSTTYNYPGLSRRARERSLISSVDLIQVPTQPPIDHRTRTRTTTIERDTADPMPMAGIHLPTTQNMSKEMPPTEREKERTRRTLLKEKTHIRVSFRSVILLVLAYGSNEDDGRFQERHYFLSLSSSSSSLLPLLLLLLLFTHDFEYNEQFQIT